MTEAVTTEYSKEIMNHTADETSSSDPGISQAGLRQRFPSL